MKRFAGSACSEVFAIDSTGVIPHPEAKPTYVRPVPVARSDRGVKLVAFATATGRYARLQALGDVNFTPYSNVAELNVIGSAVAVSGPGVASATLSSSTVSGGATLTGMVTLTSPAPLGGAAVMLASSDPNAVALAASVVVDADSTTAIFTLTANPVTMATQTVITATYNGSTAATVVSVKVGNLSGTIPQSGWKLLWVDSEETACGPYGAVNAFDGDPATFWHTQYCGAAPAPPHELEIDLGALYEMSGFTYLARQDGATDGNITQYNFYVSEDGVNWGTPVSSGVLMTDASDRGVKLVAFATATGRYARLQALGDVNFTPYSNVAELNIIGH